MAAPPRLDFAPLVSTDSQSVEAQLAQLRAAGAEKVYRDTASDTKTSRAQLRRVLAQLDKGDVPMVPRLDRLARSSRDPLNTHAAIADKGAGFRSLGATWADTTTAQGRLMPTVLGVPIGFQICPPIGVEFSSCRQWQNPCITRRFSVSTKTDPR